MNINSLANTPLLPQEAANSLTKSKDGADPSLRSQQVAGIEPVQKPAKETSYKQSTPEKSNTGKVARSNGHSNSGKEVSARIPGQPEEKSGAQDTTGRSADDKQILKTNSKPDGPQLQLLKRQLVAKRSLARQIYLNTLETKVVDNIGSKVGALSEEVGIAEVTETLNDYAQIIKRDLTFSQQEGHSSVAVHDRSSGELVRTISSEEAILMSEDLEQFKTGHLLEVRV